MTSPVSSAKTNPARHALNIALREGMAVGIVGALLLALTVIAPIFTYYGDPYYGDQVVYAYGYSGFYFAYPLLAALLGFTQALFSFRLLTNRSASNVYFGLGLSRRQVFDARFAAGVLWLAAAVIVAMAGGAAVNLLHSDQPGLILSRAAYLGTGLLVTALTAYAVTALVCTRVGTLVEAIAYGLLALLLPTLIIHGLGNHMHTFLRGFPYGYDTRYSSMSGFELPGTLASELTVFNPLLFFKPSFETFAIYVQDQARYSSGTGTLTWGPALCWLAAAAVLFWLARWSFTARRVENTGLLGACRPLAIAVAAPAVWAAASAFLPVTEGYNHWPLSAALGAGAVMTAGVFAALCFPLRIVERGAWRGLWALPAGLAAAGLSMGLMAAGGLGYTGFVPETGSIASVEITYKGLPGLVPSRNYEYPYLPSYQSNAQITLTDPADTALARTLHQSLLADGYGEGIPNYTLVRYTLRDGRTVLRFYRTASMQTLRAMLDLDDTAPVADAVRAAFEGPAASPDDEPDYSNPDSAFTSGTVYLAGPLSSQAVLLDANTLTGVRQALAEDLLSQPSDDRYFPGEADICTLYFIGYRWYQNSYYPESTAVDSLEDLGEMAPLTLNAAFTRTLAALEEPLSRLQAADIEWIRLGPDYGKVLSGHTLNPNVSPFFRCLAIEQDDMDYFTEREFAYAGETDPTPITDTGRVEALYAASRGFYHASDSGYLIYVKLRDSDIVAVRYIPRDLLPDWAAR